MVARYGTRRPQNKIGWQKGFGLARINEGGGWFRGRSELCPLFPRDCTDVNDIELDATDVDVLRFLFFFCGVR